MRERADGRGLLFTLRFDAVDLRATAYETGLSWDPLGVAMLGIGDGEIPDVPWTGGKSALLEYADHTMVFGPSDPDRPNVLLQGRFAGEMRFDRTVRVWVGDDARSSLSFGDIELENADGALDDLVARYAVDGQEARLFMGPRYAAKGSKSAASWAEQTQMMTVQIIGWQPGQETVGLEIGEEALGLDSVVQTAAYGGSGGADGAAEVAGVRKPLCFGDCRNLTPYQCDPAGRLYQVHSEAIVGIPAVRANGVPLTQGADHPTSAALMAAVLGAGSYATCLAEGVFRLGSDPDGTLTADVIGDATLGAAPSAAEIAVRLLEGWAGIRSDRIAKGSWWALPAGDMALVVAADSSESTGDLINRLMSGLWGWWGVAGSGQIRAGIFQDLAGLPTVASITETDLLSLEEASPLPILRRLSVAYGRNWTSQTNLPGSVSAADRAAWERDHLSARSVSNTALANHLGALDVDLSEALWVSALDAQAVADRAIAALGQQSRLWELRLHGPGTGLSIGDVVSLSYPRLGLSAGTKAMVIGIAEAPMASDITLTLWGRL
ncbi:MAG: hypothetical protein ACPGOY_04730 [Rhodospirillaceae bacterium]